MRTRAVNLTMSVTPACLAAAFVRCRISKPWPGFNDERTSGHGVLNHALSLHEYPEVEQRQRVD